MKKLFAAFFIILAACSPQKISSRPTVTPLIIPKLNVTPEPTRTPIIVTPTPAPSAANLFYVVKVGDTLNGISQKFGISEEQLAQINGIKNPDLIQEGEQLVLADRDKLLQSIYAETGKRIIVILSEQMVYAVENTTVMGKFLVSTGVAAHPTVVGRYQIYVKLLSTEMSGGVKGVDYYDLPDVPYTMYFYKGYGLHGTYWHHNFGHPMSHGCVNMYTPDAKEVFDWAEVGTTVYVVP